MNQEPTLDALADTDEQEELPQEENEEPEVEDSPQVENEEPEVEDSPQDDTGDLSDMAVDDEDEPNDNPETQSSIYKYQ